jgi:glutamine---fructose-6-phosphate transaminase (isomerizing)
MCGIIGYKGNRNASDLVVKALKQLEYRGYDSWGIACKIGNEIKIHKKIGKIGKAKLDGFIESKVAIAHTRWATHGKVTDENAHPHFSADKKLAVIHNGIIENFEEIQLELTKKGYKFNSQTDTEVIPHLIDEYQKKNDFVTSVKLTLKRLKGTYAILVISQDSDLMIAARKASPLVLGIGENEYFIASDIPAFLEYTKKVVFLDDNEMVVLNKNYEIINTLTDQLVKKEIVEIEWNAEQAQKGKYEHFMLKEIFEQPEAIKNTFSSRIKDNKVTFEDFCLSDEYFKSINKITIIACGTSWHAALVGKYTLEALSKIPVEVDYASEFRYRNPIVNEKTLVIAISQSGETADTMAAIKEAKSKGSKVLSICNVIGSTISRESDCVIYTRAGIEIGVASTKAFTTQLCVIYLFGVYLAQIKKTWSKEHLDERIEFLKKIPSLIQIILNDEKKIVECAKEYYTKKNALYLGRGTNFPIALEGALKLKEVSYLHAEGYPAAEMKHGPIALIDKEMPTIFICVKDESYTKIKSNMQETKARGGKIITIATENDEDIKKLSDNVLYVPKTSGLLYPFLTVIPLQLLAYHVAKYRECDIDKPKNLAKSVTVE